MKRSVGTPCDRFPNDFMYVVTRVKYNSLRSQILTLENGKGEHSKYLPY